jgi:hypothetical protein
MGDSQQAPEKTRANNLPAQGQQHDARNLRYEFFFRIWGAEVVSAPEVEA